MSTESYFHVGIVVADLDAARARLTELIGVEWGPVVEHTIDVRDADGNALSLPNRICYSTTTPHLELVQEQPGTMWTCNEHSNLHHLCIGTTTVSGTGERLEGLQCPLALLAGHDPAVEPSWTYHRDQQLGFYLEVMSEQLRGQVEAYLCRPEGEA